MRRSGLNGEHLSAVLGSIVIHGFVLSFLVASAYTVSPVLIPQDVPRLNVSWITLSSRAEKLISYPAVRTHEIPVVEEVVPAQAPAGGVLGEKREPPPAVAARAESGAAVIARNFDRDATARGRDDAPLGSASSEKDGSLTITRSMGGPPGDTMDVSLASPRYRDNTRLAYPLIARMRGYEGVVLLAAEVGVDGRVGALRIKKSSGYPVLDRCAYDTVLTWRFEPGRRMGKPVPMWVDVPVRFVLRDG